MKITPHQYIIEIKMLKAKELLKAGYKISEISNLIGFYNEKAFSRAFKKHEGFSPVQFKLHKNF